jgi:hypothetical protein
MAREHPMACEDQLRPRAPEQLKNLADMHASGALSDEEFAATKSRPLGS